MLGKLKIKLFKSLALNAQAGNHGISLNIIETNIGITEFQYDITSFNIYLKKKLR